jgi:rod shape-determining protein MreD
MGFLRTALVAAILLTALLLQLTVLPWIHLPGSTPDLLLVAVAALGLAGGPVRGAAAGFAGGLLVDIVPPANGVLGLSAVVLTVVGYLAGEFGDRRDDRPALVTLAFVTLLGGLAVAGYAIFGSIVGDNATDWNQLPLLIITAALYAVVMAAFVVPAIGALVRRLEPNEQSYQVGRYDR